MSPEVTTNDLRQRGPPSSRHLRIPRQLKLPSSPAHRNSPGKPKRSRPKPSKVLTKCYSEPLIFQPNCDEDHNNPAGNSPNFDSGESDVGYLTRFHTLNDVLSSNVQPTHSPLSRYSASYDKDAKVLITVTVEGSPGPIRTLVKLGTSVEETINLVVHKYAQERRTPLFDNHSSSFDLHVSYFSLDCLERTESIGEAGSRSFYLRKKDKKRRDHERNSLEVGATALGTSNGLHQYDNDDAHKIMNSPSKQLNPSMGIFPPYIATKMNKIERRFIRLFKVLGCLDSK